MLALWCVSLTLPVLNHYPCCWLKHIWALAVRAVHTEITKLSEDFSSFCHLWAFCCYKVNRVRATMFSELRPKRHLSQPLPLQMREMKPKKISDCPSYKSLSAGLELRSLALLAAHQHCAALWILQHSSLPVKAGAHVHGQRKPPSEFEYLDFYCPLMSLKEIVQFATWNKMLPSLLKYLSSHYICWLHGKYYFDLGNQINTLM